jgi:hypothetical protein
MIATLAPALRSSWKTGSDAHFAAKCSGVDPPRVCGLKSTRVEEILDDCQVIAVRRAVQRRPSARVSGLQISSVLSEQDEEVD